MVYELREDLSALPVYTSFKNFDETIHLNLYREGDRGHLSLIIKFDLYSSQFQCSSCNTHFEFTRGLAQHRKHCSLKSKYRFPGKSYRPPQNVLQKLKTYGIDVPTSKNENLIFYYLESARTTDAVVRDDPLYEDSPSCTTLEFLHTPLSISVSSNVSPAYQRFHVADQNNPTKVVHQFVQRIIEIAKHNKKLQLAKHAASFQKIDSLVTEWEDKLNNLTENQQPVMTGDDSCQNSPVQNNDIMFSSTVLDTHDPEEDLISFSPLVDMGSDASDISFNDLDLDPSPSEIKMCDCILTCICQGPPEINDNSIPIVEPTPMTSEQRKIARKNIKKHISNIKQLREDLVKYLQQIPVLGFQNSYYNSNVLKQYIFNILLQNNEEIQFVAKRGSSYLAILTTFFRFLSLDEYVPAGYSMNQFLHSYCPQYNPSFFPANINWEAPNALSLPVGNLTYNNFYDSLTQTNTLNSMHIDYEEAIRSGSPNNVAWEKLGLHSPPKKGPDVWLDYRKTFAEKRLITLADLLRFHCNNMSLSGLHAAQNMNEFYYCTYNNVSLFKMSFSLPGIAKHIAHANKPPNVYFPLFPRRDSDLQLLFREHMVGGCSTVFCRIHEKGRTNIKDSANICNNIFSIDYNGLYSAILAGDLPTGAYIRRHCTENFFPRRMYHDMLSIRYLDWVSKTQNIEIEHSLNGGEVKIANFRIDGFDRAHSTIYSFLGCVTHLCDCAIQRGITDFHGKSIESVRNYDSIRFAILRSLGYTVIIKRECSFLSDIESDPNLKKYMETHELPRNMKKKYTQASMAEAISSQDVEGFVRCSISVPDDKISYFSDFPPVFKRAEVGYAQYSSIIKKYLSQQVMPDRPRSLVVQSMFSTDILIATPLLAYYISRGIRVNHIEEVIQFRMSQPFKDLIALLTKTRIDTDKGLKTPLHGQSAKLVSCSIFGNFLLAKERQNVVTYINDESEISRRINSKRFRDFNAIGKGVYELTSAKAVVSADIPIYIALWTLNLAKMKVLIAVDFLKDFLISDTYEIMYHNTDNLVIAISRNNLQECVKPEKLQEFLKVKDQFFANPRSPESKRQPGLFKTEFICTGFVVLTGRTYACQNVTSGTGKKAILGINSKFFNEAFLRMRNVLLTEDPEILQTRGVIARNNTLYTYSQRRLGPSFMYVNRPLIDYRRTTHPNF